MNKQELPTGTVTFFFSDIEGSTKLLQELGQDRFRDTVEEHQRIVREAIAGGEGTVIGTEGDSFFAVFESAPHACSAAIAVQRRLATHDDAVRIRIGLHTGEGMLGGDNYVGLDVHRGARIAAVGYGGQILISEATQTLVGGALPDGAELKDLGTHRLKDLSKPERIYQVVIPDLQADFPALKSLDARPNNLPVQLTSFIGRDKELNGLMEVLSQNRVVTLTGPGGTGKTRLSIQLAAEASDDFPDGIYFVALAPISDPELVAPAIAEALSLAEAFADQRTPLERVTDYLKAKKVLLILDNFEQVLDAASVVNDLVRSSEHLKIVVTSRAALHVYGEIEFPVPSLQLPDPKHLPDLESLSQFESVALFIQRAMAVKADFRVTSENAPSVAEICARLDGLPLAIELAAARVRALTPDALLSRLGERLRLLVGGSRDLPARQQTLRQAIEWSYDLLDPPERKLFWRLSVFMGSFSLDEAELVCGPADDLEMDVLDGVTSMLDKSLVRSIDSPEPRYLMLETIREFAVEKLEGSGEVQEIRRRHAEAFVRLAEQAEPAMITAKRAEWLDRLERDHDNFRAAHDWCIAGKESALAFRLLTALWRFWQMRGHLVEATSLAEEVLTLSGPEDRSTLRAKALQAAGGIAYWSGDQETTKKHYQEALSIWREIGDKSGIAGALYDAGFQDLSPEGAKIARPAFEEAIALYKEVGDRHGEAKVNWGIGVFDIVAQQFETVADRLQPLIGIFRQAGDDFMVMWSLNQLGNVNIKTGRFADGRANFIEAMEMAREANDLSAIIFQLDNLSDAARQEGHLERAVKLRAASVSLLTSSGLGLADISREALGTELMKKELLEQDRLRQIWAEGEAMSLDEAVAYALSSDS
jgi:predicted ATPase/class 3 adenylate cyclase